MSTFRVRVDTIRLKTDYKLVNKEFALDQINLFVVFFSFLSTWDISIGIFHWEFY